MAVDNPPAGYSGATPYLIVKDAGSAIDWYVKALGATLVYKMDWGGKVGHAEMAIGGGHFMMADEFPDMGHLSPLSRGGTTVSMMVYVPDVDAAHARAVAAGAKEDFPLENKPWGDRAGMITDPFGHRWTLATHVEDVPWDELDRRMADMAPKGGD
ncbi:VOC family protein [Sandaracinobacteroides hominis]|uniref:VOC family protein n=1 Tax=Sandaracinobacteroides hominis TaxID=2780086 RepID=UPI0018F3A997|nr:VOC family protein [Sandaracinobacteroides hominis]